MANESLPNSQSFGNRFHCRHCGLIAEIVVKPGYRDHWRHCTGGNRKSCGRKLTDADVVPATVEKSRVCRICSTEKPIESFPRRYGPRGKGLREWNCGMCKKRAYAATDSERFKLNRAAEDRRRRAKAKGLSVEAYLAEREQRRLDVIAKQSQLRIKKVRKGKCPVLRANRRLDYLANRESYKQKSREYYSKNLAKSRKRVQRWKRDNPAQVSVQRYRRRAAFETAVCTLTEDQWAGIKAAYKHRCAYCGKRKPLTQDHVIPIVKGGSHTADNIVPACQSCNSQKHAGKPRVIYQPHLIC